MQSSKRLKITDVNPHLICVLCGGYYIDATTINECLHSFCRTCIVRYLENNKYCPICDVQVHKSCPLLNIRTDKTLQNIVYKLVPSLFQNEMRRRIEFYSKYPEVEKPGDPELRGEVGEHSTIYLPDEPISICLEYQPSSSLDHQGGKRFLHCPAAVTISHLQKLLRGKFSLGLSHQVSIFYKEEYLHENLSLMDVAYIYHWRRKSPIHMTYQILEIKRKKMKMSPISNKEEEKEKEGHGKPPGKDKEWKEVLLEISENGVMSVRNIGGTESRALPAPEAANCEPPINPAPPPTPITPVTSTSESQVSRDPIVSVSKVSKEQAVMKKPNVLEVNNLSISRVPPGGLVKEKGDVLNRIVSKLSPNERVIGNTSVTIRPVTTPKVYSGVKPPPVEKKPVQQFKYKTLKTSTKPWNPSIDRSTMLSMKQNSTEEQTKAPRFFKMRNMPRYLGNPASGVKPMFQVGGGGEGQQSQPPPPPQQQQTHSKQRFTLMKVDPKTLAGVPPRSPTKMPPPFTPGSPKRSPNPYTAPPPSFPRIPSPAHAGSFLPTNPYHLLCSGFTFPPGVDSAASRLLAGSGPDFIRSMCGPAAFHPSLPPSISMLFNPLHSVQRPNQESFKLDPSPPPTVQRIPPTNVSKSDILSPKHNNNNNEEKKSDKELKREEQPAPPPPPLPLPPEPPATPLPPSESKTESSTTDGSSEKLPLKPESEEKTEPSPVNNDLVTNKSDNNNKDPSLEISNKLENSEETLSKDITLNNNITKESPLNNSEGVTPTKQ